MAQLLFVKGPHEGTEVELPDEGEVSMGRGQDTDVPLNDDAVSTHHATVRLFNGSWCFVDLDSTNGSQVNGTDVRECTLSDGDLIKVGQSQIRFVEDVGSRIDDVLGKMDPDSAAPAVESPAPVESQPPPRPNPATSAPRIEPEQVLEAVGDDEGLALVREMRDRTELIRREIGKVIVGQREVIDQILMCIIANGHALLIGLPGMAKTLTVRTLAYALNLAFKRVQFTPDLMPSDIIGTDVLETDQSTGEKHFRFIQGPIFCNLLLADEINRTPPKTQAALLEAMQEKCVTAGNETYHLDAPFFVLATQNPIEQEGTYPLPEAQLDRFMFNIWVDYPEEHEEEAIVTATTAGSPAKVNPVMTQEEILKLQEVVRKVPVSQHVIKYAIRLVRATRPGNPDAPEIAKTYISTGAGPRAGQYLILAAKAMAILEGRIHVSCNDIRRAATPVLRHRILTNFTADSEGKTTTDLINDLIGIVQEPSEKDYAEAV